MSMILFEEHYPMKAPLLPPKTPSRDFVIVFELLGYFLTDNHAHHWRSLPLYQLN